MSCQRLSSAARREDWDAALHEIQQISGPAPTAYDRLVNGGAFLVRVRSRVLGRGDNYSSTTRNGSEREKFFRLGTQIACIISHGQRVGIVAEKERGRVEIIQLLLQILPPATFLSRSNVTKLTEPELPLHAACGGWERYVLTPRNDEIIIMLLKAHPAAASVRNDKGELPLHIAACAAAVGKLSPHVLELIVARYPRGCRMTDDNGDYPLHRLCRFFKMDDADVAGSALESLRILLHADSVVARRRSTLSQRLPMHELALAAPTQSLLSPTKDFVISAAQNLLDRHRKAIYSPDVDGFRPFQHAVQSRCAPLIQFLLSFDPLQSALESTDEEMNVRHVPLHEILRNRYELIPNSRLRINVFNIPISEKQDLAAVDTVKCLLEAHPDAANDWLLMRIPREHMRILAPLRIFANTNAANAPVMLLPIQLCTITIIRLLQMQSLQEHDGDHEDARNVWLESHLRRNFQILSLLVQARPLLIWAKHAPHEKSVVEMLVDHQNDRRWEDRTPFEECLTFDSFLRIAFPRGLHTPCLCSLPPTAPPSAYGSGSSSSSKTKVREDERFFAVPFVAACLHQTTSLDVLFALLRHDPHVALASHAG